MRRAMTGLACFAVTLLAATSAFAQGTVKIGVVMSFSGQFADPGAQIDNGIKLYMKQNGDTVAGKKIEIIRKVEKVAGEPQNVAFDKVENVKDPLKARMPK